MRLLMRLITSVNEMKALTRENRSRGRSVGLVPTMGALHKGHVSLVRQAKQQCDVVVVSVFVNPMQFGPEEDYERYPRNLEEDFQLLSSYNIDTAFAPSLEEMYPEGFQTFVEPGPLAKVFEGASRPGHFRGVSTVVVKLFNIVQPDMAYFGQKDFQQAIVIRRLVEDLNLNVRLVLCPIVRDEDGLAISSRNVYLKPAQRKSALALSRSLWRAEELIHSGEPDASKILEEMRHVLQRDVRLKIDYLAIVNPVSFEPASRVSAGAIALVAAYVDRVRLIDNTILGPVGASQEDRLQMALSAPAVTTPEARAPGIDAEAVIHKIEGCRDCAAISTILLPPREFMASYIKRDYPDLSTVRTAVIGRHSTARADNSFYRNGGRPNRFVTALYDLLGISDFAEFKKRFILTDIIHCHASGPRIPDKAMRNCSRHLRNELSLFPNLQSLVVLGEDAYWGVQRFLLERDPGEIQSFSNFIEPNGWVEEEARISALDNRTVKIFYCHHPSLGYQRSPSLASALV
ncbi:MAG: pantoate--beta-alanine ligase [Acidobacteria bacterium]|nr:MAG: pantoate--beta-alanine ligase [Acidobacteriota bacterium]